MTLSTFLDVAISLVFVFFTISMFVSGIVELINAFLEQRSKLLKFALIKLFTGQEEGQKHRQVLWDFFDRAPLPGVFLKFWNHPTVQVKRQRFWGDKPISYLSGDSFSTVIIDLLASDTTVDTLDPNAAGQTLDRIRATVSAVPKPDDTNDLTVLSALVKPLLLRSNTLAEFKANLERWYDGYMEQVSGWYKRYTQGVVWIVAAMVTMAMNVDTILITKRLFNDGDLRAGLVAQAQRVAQTQTKEGLFTTDSAGASTIRRIPRDPLFGMWLAKHDSTLNTRFQSSTGLTGADSLNVQTAYVQYLQSNIGVLQLPIGWTFPAKEKVNFFFRTLFSLTGVGWLLTIAALSFGAPFWFDVLVKLVNIRNTARRPLSSAVPDSR